MRLSLHLRSGRSNWPPVLAALAVLIALASLDSQAKAETLRLMAFGDSLTEAADRIREKAQLLQDGIVGNRAQLGRVLEIDLAGPAVVLPLRWARAGAMQEVRSIGAEQGTVAGIVHDLLIEAPNDGEELVDVVTIGVERIISFVFVDRRQRMGQYVSERGERGIFGDEDEIAVTTLKADLLLVRYAECRQLRP